MSIDTNPPPTIFPSITSEEGQAIGTSLQILAQAGVKGSASHLRKSAECINEGDWAGGVRESVHAVESAARQLDPNASSLAPALRSLEKRSALHLLGLRMVAFHTCDHPMGWFLRFPRRPRRNRSARTPSAWALRCASATVPPRGAARPMHNSRRTTGAAWEGL